MRAPCGHKEAECIIGNFWTCSVCARVTELQEEIARPRVWAREYCGTVTTTPPVSLLTDIVRQVKAVVVDARDHRGMPTIIPAIIDIPAELEDPRDATLEKAFPHSRLDYVPRLYQNVTLWWMHPQLGIHVSRTYPLHYDI